ncbi:MAG: FtsX-like permease family protein [Lachnospiraceae bacterium]|nr:FtsX-like permease family protein [Lachnospiraceae bacterium]
MSLIFSDLKHLIRKEKYFLIQIMSLHMISFYLIMFIFDALLNNYMVSQETENGTLSYNVDFNGYDVLYEEIENVFFEMNSGKYGNLIKQITVSNYIVFDDFFYNVFSPFKIKGNQYVFGNTFDKYVVPQLSEGRMFTPEEFNSDEKVTISMFFDENVWNFDGQVYSVIGKRKTNQEGYEDGEGAIPYSVFIIPPRCFEGHIISDCTINTARILTSKETDGIKALFEEKIPDRFELRFQSENSEEKLAVIKTAFAAGGLIIFAAVGALIIIYAYYFAKRKKRFAVWRFVGLSRNKTILAIVCELTIITAVSLLVGLLLFVVSCKKFISGLYKYTEYLMTAKVAALFFIGIFSLLLIINIGISVFASRVKVREMLSDKGK